MDGPDASIHFCHSKAQAQASSNRRCLLQNSSFLFREVGFQLNLDVKEHILSFFSSSGSYIFHPYSFPVAVQELVLPCSPEMPLVPFVNSARMRKGRSGLPCAHPEHPLLSILGLTLVSWTLPLLPGDAYLSLPHLSQRAINPSGKMQGQTFQFRN